MLDLLCSVGDRSPSIQLYVFCQSRYILCCLSHPYRTSLLRLRAHRLAVKLEEETDLPASVFFDRLHFPDFPCSQMHQCARQDPFACGGFLNELHWILD